MRVCRSLFLLPLSRSLVQARHQTLVTHEKREDSFEVAANRQRIEPDALLPMRIGLKQNYDALSKAESWLMDVSDPDSTGYGQFWTQADVVEAFRPFSETERVVTEWLNSHGVTEFTHSDNKQWFAFDMSVGEAEKMLTTQYFEQEVKSEKDQMSAFEASCDRYYLPAYVSEHIDFITPGIKSSDVTGRTNRSQRYSKAIEKRYWCPVGGGIGSRDLIQARAMPTESTLEECRELITPACVRMLYDIPLPDPGSAVDPNNTLGVFQAVNELYFQGSLDLFYERYTDIPAGTSPFFQAIDGALYPPNRTHGEDWKLVAGEGNADLEAALPTIYPQNATVLQVGSPKNLAGGYQNFLNRFLDAIDGSFCTPSLRENGAEGGRPKCGILKPTNLITVSYGLNEHGLSSFWRERGCLEYLKLGLQGVSVFIASGDEGVGYLGPPRTTKQACSEKGSTGKFGPSYPASCPWVTTVGATEIGRESTISEPETAAMGWYHDDGHLVFGYSSGGGFSITFDRPQYQESAVSQYLNTSAPPWPWFENGQYRNNSGKYNRKGRGFPDIAANGKKVALCGWNLCKQLNCSFTGGTSLSTPFVAAMFNRIVEERLTAGKGPLEFVNPAIYKHPDAFTDIVKGGNGLCGPKGGFECAPGWDAVTGLGTPSYLKLLDVFMKLP